MKTLVQRILFNRWSAFFHDLLWIPVIIFLAYWVRFNLDSIPGIFRPSLVKMIFLAVPIQGAAFWLFGLYRGMWRYASIQDLVRILKAVFWGTLILTMVTVVLYRMERIPRSVLLLYPLFLTIALVGPRVLYRYYKEHRLHLRPLTGLRTLIVGAGSTGELVLRDLASRDEYQPIAFIDDDKLKQGREIHGVRVWGGVKDLDQIITGLSVDLILIAITTANRSTIRTIVEQAGRAGVECRTIPSAAEIVDQKIDVNQIRPVTVDDLLGRELVQLDKEAISEYLQGKNILVTGGGGSIGSELCRQVCQMEPDRLIILDNGEFNLYTIDHELTGRYPELQILSILGDVKSPERVEWVFETYRPDVVFHAAAYKHVPMLETNPAEGVQNNVTGTKIVADMAHRYHCDRFVMVSTDKAVNPTNVMGATKRVSELYCQNQASRSQTKFITTRFGNVLGSAGSVVPLFERQIRQGFPVTVTHEQITRYFMTIPEAVSLILQAGAMGLGGEIFVLDMGEPVLISDLAKQMIRLSGLVPEQDIEIVYTGLRPGEKLYEEVFHENEPLQPTEHPKLMLAEARSCDWQWLLDQLERLQRAAACRDISSLIGHLHTVVPEFESTQLQSLPSPDKAGLTAIENE